MAGRSVAVVVVLTLAVAACGAAGSSPVITDARVGAPTGPNAALYFTAKGYGTDDALVAASTDVAGSVMLHETVEGSEGTMSMQHVSRLELPARGELVLEPGSYHLMLVDVDDLEVGMEIEVSLEWEVAGIETINAEVVDPSDTMGDTG